MIAYLHIAVIFDMEYYAHK